MINYRHLHYFVSVARSGGVSRAAERLHLTPQTLSGQITQFEERLGVALFRRVGRRLELTETGKLALSYAEEIFQTGAELEDLLKNGSDGRFITFRVGIADVVPKFIAHRLLAPVLELPAAARLICQEDRLERLLADLAIHRLDSRAAADPSGCAGGQRQCAGRRLRHAAAERLKRVAACLSWPAAGRRLESGDGRRVPQCVTRG